MSTENIVSVESIAPRILRDLRCADAKGIAHLSKSYKNQMKMAEMNYDKTGDRFYNDESKEPIAIIRADPDDDAPTNAEYKSVDPNTVSVIKLYDQKPNIYAYPNPAIDQVRFDVLPYEKINTVDSKNSFLSATRINKATEAEQFLKQY